MQFIYFLFKFCIIYKNESTQIHSFKEKKKKETNLIYIMHWYSGMQILLFFFMNFL